MRFTSSAVIAGLLALSPQWALASSDNIEEVDIESFVDKYVPLKTHSLVAPYVDTDLQNRWWDFGADTVINTNKHVRLTQDRPSQTGWLWSRMPVNVANFQIEFEFKVDGKAHNLFGDGFAMWIAKDRATVGPVFGSVDFFNGLGLFFDTYSNSRHTYSWPRVTAMIGDGKTQYDHDHDNEAHELAGCSENFRRRDFPTRARLTYIKNKGLSLKLQTRLENEWIQCFQTKVVLPEAPYIGFSALTGDVSDSHDIVSVNGYTILLKPEYRDLDAAIGQQPYRANAGSTSGLASGGRPPARSGGASWFLWIIKLIGCLALVAFMVVAWRFYQAQKKPKRYW